jgi:sugar lactone lactonase YvrE
VWRMCDKARRQLLVGMVVLLIVGYLLLWPVPIDPVAWQAPASPGIVGGFAVSERLSQLNKMPLSGGVGPETIALGSDGKLYTGVTGGDILRWNSDGSGLEVWANSGGLVLGLTMDGQGRIIAADAMRGLLMIDQNKEVSVLEDSINGTPLGFIDSVTVAKNGKIYFSEATQRFLPKKFGKYAALLDTMEHSATGRIHEYNPASRKDRVVINNLCFANGVALSSDERSLFVIETCENRVWKVSVDAANVSAKWPDPTQAKVVLSNLPGFPDNVMRGLNGRFWVGLVKPRNSTVDGLSDKPWLRKAILRLPWSWLMRRSYGRVFAMDENGSIFGHAGSIFGDGRVNRCY